MILKVAATVAALVLAALDASGQVLSKAQSVPSKPNCESHARSTYLLGSDDQLNISEPASSELENKSVRIDGEGNIELPLVGRVHVSGLTAAQTERELDKLLSTYVRHPQVELSVSEVRSQPASVLGAVNSPGIHQLQGNKTLLEMIALAGGTRSDAGYSIRITRQLEWGCIPLPEASIDPSGRFSVGQIHLKEIMGGQDPADNIQIFPHDIISVPKADMVYVVGEVKRAGGFVLGEQQTISALQALSMAEGLNTTADARHARILRPKRDTDQREEIAVDVKNLLTGKTRDVTMQADDILFIPTSAGKKAAVRAIEAAIQTGTGLVIWRTP